MYQIAQLNWTDSYETIVFGIGAADSIDEGLDTLFAGRVKALIQSGDLSTKTGEVTILPTFAGETTRVLFVGLGQRNDMTTENVRNWFGKVAKLIKARGLKDVAVALDTFTEGAARMFTEAYEMATYAHPTYKSAPNETVEEPTITLLGDVDQTDIDAGVAYGKGVNVARMLTMMPANILTAETLADYAVELAKRHDFKYRILEKEEMEGLGMGALLAVNQGSTIPPKLIVLEYRGAEEEAPIAVVGKGVTFDTGGYSIKPKDGIVGMKGDMGGAATVLGLFETLGLTRPKRNVIGIIGATDNMISGDAFKPDDVITAMNGKTIEVLNTDAEGRLVLADAVTFAKTYEPKAIIDVATLTGGVLVALGTDVTGCLTNDDSLYRSLEAASRETNELVWQMPYFDVFIDKVRKSEVADLNNSPGRFGHMIFGGAFVGEFVGDTPWLHLDIAGTSERAAANDLGPKGPTGVMVRTLARMIESWDR
ncbi:putative cytosol aminopeptidase [Exiguobacterium sp. 8H]|uniref:leucyl aminopeptidase n=1 Tax=unclassified Exiguobacterium TaxID=2644629 RepID=UPI0012F0AAB6|nr:MULTISPECIES: leucyl aminopeptidase [unclassified Exiguobacterium]VXB41723.1 putative cytosol aminopeptidase [Exiguobacterium sp. 8A]VXB42549.1 putative cytosol aminopeptidase [Exiguobacterium sp. 8H]